MRPLRGALPTYILLVVAILALLFLASVALSWTGPTTTPPTGNVNAPINTGTTDQTKNASLGVNGLAVFGNGIMSGSNRYLNWGSTSGSSGYGLRDNGGTMEFKNNSGNWTSFSGGLGWVVSGNDIYNTNSGNVGIGTTNPAANLEVFRPSEAGLGELARFATYAEYGRLSVVNTAGYIMGLDISDLDGNASKNFAISIGGTPALHIATNRNVGIGTTNPAQKLDVNGTILATAFLYSSDARLKEHVAALRDGLSKILALSPVSFTWKEGPQKGESDLGFIAQEVEQIVPEVVHTDADGMKSVDYPKLVPLLVKAIQEQQAEDERQQGEIDALRAELRALGDQQ